MGLHILYYVELFASCSSKSKSEKEPWAGFRKIHSLRVQGRK